MNIELYGSSALKKFQIFEQNKNKINVLGAVTVIPSYATAKES
jgi:hypothetical protein